VRYGYRLPAPPPQLELTPKCHAPGGQFFF
jgi:hypothetical protein